MTIQLFIEQYKDETLTSKPLPIGTTALRNYIKENKTELQEQGIVKFTEKLRSTTIDIVKHEDLYNKLVK